MADHNFPEFEMNRKQLTTIISKSWKGSSVDVHRRGSDWVYDVFIPAIIRIEKRNKGLAAKGYSIIGDVYDFNGAYLSALKAYRCTMRLDPKLIYPIREIGVMYDNMGEFNLAKVYFRRAIAADQKDIMSKADLEMLEKNLKSEALNTKITRRILRANEFLKERDPRSALKAVRGLRDNDAKVIRIICGGLTKGVDQVLVELKKIRNSSSSISFTASFWFYLASVVWKEKAFWKEMYRVRRLIRDGVFPFPKKVLRVFPPLFENALENEVEYFLLDNWRRLDSDRRILTRIQLLLRKKGVGAKISLPRL